MKDSIKRLRQFSIEKLNEKIQEFRESEMITKNVLTSILENASKEKNQLIKTN